MKTITRRQFNGDTEQLTARVAAFKQAQAEHAETVGIPAPREEDFIEHLVRSGEPFEVEALPPEPTAAELQATELAAKRATALSILRRADIEAVVAAQRARDDAMLEAAMADPGAPQEVKDYVAVRDAADASK